jgi:hypothetical protein
MNAAPVAILLCAIFVSILLIYFAWETSLRWHSSDQKKKEWQLAASRCERFEESLQVDDDTKYIIVDAEWGMCNRLRTYNTVYELGGRVGRQTIIVNDADQYHQFFGGDWEQLIQIPIPMVKRSFLEGKQLATVGTSNEDCGITVKLEDLLKVQDKYILIRSCDVIVDIELRDEFYKLLRPSERVLEIIRENLNRIQSERCVGVHIRQGNMSDYNYGYFFGKWDNSAAGENPLFCCFADPLKNLSACPANVIVIERFVEAMRAEGDNTVFFVCTDRPGCMLWLEQMFPKRILYNKIQIEYDVDVFQAFCDWYCLANCRRMILSGPSSFSTEAAKLYGAERIFL